MKKIMVFGRIPLYVDDDTDIAALENRWMRNSLCRDCRVDTSAIGEYYMVRDKVWREAGMRSKGMLCIGCLERRLGRALGQADFTACEMNIPSKKKCSARMRARLTGIEEEKPLKNLLEEFGGFSSTNGCSGTPKMNDVRH